jgi:acetolactate synthase-1/2/3 large subunit
VDNDHPNYAGDLGVGMNPALGRRLSQADAILLLGAELNDITTQDFTLIDPRRRPRSSRSPRPDAAPASIPRRSPITARPGDVLSALLSHLPDRPNPTEVPLAARADYEGWQVPQETPAT